MDKQVEDEVAAASLKKHAWFRLFLAGGQQGTKECTRPWK